MSPTRPPRNKEEESCLESAYNSAQAAKALPAASPNCSPTTTAQDALSSTPSRGNP